MVVHPIVGNRARVKTRGFPGAMADRPARMVVLDPEAPVADLEPATVQVGLEAPVKALGQA